MDPDDGLHMHHIESSGSTEAIYSPCGPDPNHQRTAMERYLSEQFESWSASNRPGLTKSGTEVQNKDLAIRAFLSAGISTALPTTGPAMVDQEYHLSESEAKQAMNKMKRIVLKGGETSIKFKNISKKKRKYFSDLYTTLLDTSWVICVLLFTTSFYLSWLIFAITYFLLSYFHGDLDPQSPGWIPCIQELDGFSSAFLFSLETQHTIGYGGRQPTKECPVAVLVVTMQAVLGCLIQAFMVGLVFSKLSRPQQRTKTVIFSQNAVINMRNKQLSLIIRIGDLRDDNFILGTKIACKLLRRTLTEEGEAVQEMVDLRVEPNSNNESCIFFVWPLEIIHIIDESSPLFCISASDLAREKFEVVIIMEGTIETSSMTFQARSSYLASEILWGHRFEYMTIYRRDRREFEVNFSAFHSTFPVETPTCSAQDLQRYQQQQQLVHKSSALHLINNLTNLPPENVSSVLNIAHKIVADSKDNENMSPMIGSGDRSPVLGSGNRSPQVGSDPRSHLTGLGSEASYPLRSNSISDRESLLRKASVNAFLAQKCRGVGSRVRYHTNTTSSTTSKPYDETETQSDSDC